MRVIARRNLIEFGSAHPEARESLRRWFSIAQNADWSSTNDVLATFRKAKALNGERVRFAVHGGAYRLVVAFNFRRQIAFIKFIGTHAEYDAVDALTVEMF